MTAGLVRARFRHVLTCLFYKEVKVFIITYSWGNTISETLFNKLQLCMKD